MSASCASAVSSDSSPACSQRPWLQARNILVVRLDSLGDVVMTTPAIAAIKHSTPSARITLLASHSGAAAAQHVPSLDDVIVYDAPWIQRANGADDERQGDLRIVDELARRRFDAAVIFTVCTQSALPAALMCRLAGIPLRLAHSRENPYELLTNWVPDAEVCASGMRHEVMRQLDLVRSVGFHACDERMQFRYSAAEVLSMRRNFVQSGGDLLRFLGRSLGAIIAGWLKTPNP